MHLTWRSRQGLGRVSNNDAVALYQNDLVFLAILVDSAEKNGELRQLNFSKYWSDMVMTGCVKYINSSPKLKIASDEIINLMKEGQKSLRRSYLHDKASYIIILLDKHESILTVLHCGDCLLGEYQDNGLISWLVEPHNVYQQHKNLPTENGLPYPLENTRFILTRSLNAKRFSQPEINRFCVSGMAPLLLSTDGYWAEHITDGVSWDHLEDDASALIIDFSAVGVMQINSDCENFADYTLSC
ncbi:hypothetical protein PZA22_08100 [Pectobacterium polaris]|uniref:hypothetical protein n=1 Tax=Pectobacterium polaris TaxID=2042057 RepID=UPI0023B18413|nr:hypothetical protein [Pectobacterium polaris]MDE8742613.1 hypothetical protein [Pectobacterium polaris]MDE8754459.1 hypothetical protein [Pectobacterium polaris]